MEMEAMENETFTNTASLCERTKLVMTPSYRSLVASECLVGILAVPPNVFLLCVIWRVGIFSQALRILLAHLNFVLLWYSLGGVVRSMHALLTPECGYRMSLAACKIIDIFSVGLAVPCAVFSFLAFCLHRLYVSLRYRSYEKKLNDWLPCVLIIGPWIGSMALQATDLVGSDWSELVPACVSPFVSFRTSWAMFYAKLVCESAAVVIGVFVYFYTRHLTKTAAINKAKYDLSSRFQISENRRINEMMVPAMVLHFICHIPNFVFLSSMFGLWDTSYHWQKPWLSRLPFLCLLIFALIHPILMFHFNVDLKKVLMKTTVGGILNKIGKAAACKLMTKKRVADVVQTFQTTHFNYLDNIWMRAKERREVRK